MGADAPAPAHDIRHTVTTKTQEKTVSTETVFLFNASMILQRKGAAQGGEDTVSFGGVGVRQGAAHTVGLSHRRQ